MISAFLAIAAAAATPQAGVQVDVGQANWANYPRLIRAERPFPTEPMVDYVSEVLRERRCSFPGQTDRTFDITVPYLALVEPTGRVSRVVVGETGCRPIETFVGEIVVEIARQGDFRRSATSSARWYASEINFNLDDHR